jgi:ABC-type xylose transport system permease subunit
MSSRASAPPTSARVEIGVGTALASVGALILVVHVGQIPGFVAELVIGFVDVPAFWPMVGGALLLAGGVYSVWRGRRGVRNHRRAVARIEAMRVRQQQRQPHGAGGVSAGVAGTVHRAPARF